MASALLTVTTATFAIFFSHGFRGKGRGRGKIDFCADVQSALAGDVAEDRIVMPSDGAVYEASVEQYASSSLPEGSLHPSAVVYVESAQEAQKVVQYATTCKFTVAVRSGGHQYSGLSSCSEADGKCIQIDVSRMDALDINPSGRVTAGPGISLERLYAELAENQMFVGAGECSGVFVGGHAQTGGAGIYSRSFGYLADHVEEFEIVLAGGMVRRVTKPTSWRGNPLSWNDRLFWAVLGGNAGSWGVVTSYTLQAHRDCDYPESTYYSCLAEWTADAYLAAGNVLNEMISDKQWQTESAGDESAFITISKRQPIEANTLHVEGVWPGLNGKPFNDKYFQKFTKALQKVTTVTCSAVLSPPSRILRDNITLYAPREYPFPYVRSARAVKSTLDKNALSIFANSIDSMMADVTNGVYPVQQLATFAGATNTPYTSQRSPIPHRDARIILGLNAFYGEQVNPAAKTTAMDFIANTWGLLEETKTFKNQDHRISWAPLGDLRIENTWRYFWDPATFFKLRAVKTLVDPTDVFRTPFTIPPFTRRC